MTSPRNLVYGMPNIHSCAYGYDEDTPLMVSVAVVTKSSQSIVNVAAGKQHAKLKGGDVK